MHCSKRTVYKVIVHGAIHLPSDAHWYSSQKTGPYVYRRGYILHTLLIRLYNDLLERQSSERGKDEVTYFYVGDFFCIHLGTKYVDFQ